MKDYKVKLRDLQASHTLGCAKKKKDAQIRSVRRRTNSQCKRPDVLGIAGIKEIALEGRLLQSPWYARILSAAAHFGGLYIQIVRVM
jgi:hypothetical protein